jgi:predicted nucleic acid-binding protein
VALTAVLDANVLYSAYLRDVLLRLAAAEVYQVRWNEQILEEMSRNLKKRVKPELHHRVDHTVNKMKRAFPEGRVTGHESLIPSMTNNAKDRRVLAAAVEAGADVIVTSNLKHFPPSACAPHKIDVQSPDRFLCYQRELRDPEHLAAVPEAWASGLKTHRSRWRRFWRATWLAAPPCSATRFSSSCEAARNLTPSSVSSQCPPRRELAHRQTQVITLDRARQEARGRGVDENEGGRRSTSESARCPSRRSTSSATRRRPGT